MKKNTHRYYRSLWAFAALAAMSIGLGRVLMADPNHPAATAPAPSGAEKKEPAAYSPEVIYERVKALRAKAMPGEPLDEALGGKTMKGTPITPRIPECFPAEGRDLFWRMDKVSAGKDVPLQPLNFDTNGDGKIDDQERNAIRGRNTWLLWGGGNDGFWNWLAQDGYGITDFLVQLDSRRRDGRFVRTGVMNQPGFRANSDPAKRILGLYLDVPIQPSVKSRYAPGETLPPHVLTPPPWDKDAGAYGRPSNHAEYETIKADENDPYGEVIAQQSALFKAGDEELFKDTVRKLAAMGDGVDYTVYGFPTGIFGLRMFLNPDFFGPGEYAKRARNYWNERVVKTNDRYYTDPTVTKDPELVRPFRISVSCGFCHIGPHPLNPPKNIEAPEWENMSSTIGAQYWKPQPAFGNLQTGNSILFHFLASQRPGTVDTSLVSTDHINNANTMNAVWEINARLARAVQNPSEQQSPANVRTRSIEDNGPAILDPEDLKRQPSLAWRHTPRVLVDGSDSIGAFGALARVYLNIGTFYEEWGTCHNPLVGFRPQRPFKLETCQRNSVYWQTNEIYRTNYLAAFFTMKFAPKPADAASVPATPPASDSPSKYVHNSTQAMKLIATKEADGKTSEAAEKSLGLKPVKKVTASGETKEITLNTPEQRQHGREVWMEHCAICHSSKQPDGFALSFDRKDKGVSWDTQPAPKDHHYVLPMDASDWLAFKRSPAYGVYRNSLRLMAEQAGKLTGDPLMDEHPFWKDNFLSSEIRIPVTLVGTNSGRAMGTNGIANSVWDNFSSNTYKELPAVGTVNYFNPIGAKAATYAAPGGGRGYYRPATHVSLWATAPFLHNNSMGIYLDDPSVKGRLVQFTDAMRRMLWEQKRASRSLVLSEDEFAWLNEVQANDASKIDPNIVVTRAGDLRGGMSSSAAKDPGFIYRLPQEASVEFPAVFARALIAGIAGKGVTSLLEFWLWVILGVLCLLLAWKHKARYLGITLVLIAVLVAVGIAITGIGGGGSTVGALLMAASGLLAFSSWQWWGLAIALAVFGFIFIQARPDCDRTARRLLGLLLIGVAFAIVRATKSLPIGIVTIIVVWMIWRRSRPSLAGFSRGFFIALALILFGVGYVANRFINGRAIATIPFANIKIGPFDIKAGPLPRGTPINLMMNMDPTSKNVPKALVSLVVAMADIKKKGLSGDDAWKAFSDKAGQPLMDASKCPDFVLDRGHLFGETLDPDPVKNDQAKEDLIAFLKTL